MICLICLQRISHNWPRNNQIPLSALKKLPFRRARNHPGTICIASCFTDWTPKCTNVASARSSAVAWQTRVERVQNHRVQCFHPFGQISIKSIEIQTVPGRAPGIADEKTWYDHESTNKTWTWPHGRQSEHVISTVPAKTWSSPASWRDSRRNTSEQQTGVSYHWDCIDLAEVNWGWFFLLLIMLGQYNRSEAYLKH